VAETRVLIVDDDREITRAIALRLSNAGFTPITAYNGQEGLDVVQADPPHAIILDLRMPVMDGFQLLEKLQNSVHTRNIPAIILSADAADKARLKALRAGATYFVEKPYKAQDLIEALSVTLERRQADTLPPAPGRRRTAAAARERREADAAHPFEHRERIAMSATAAAPDAPSNRRVLIADDDPGVVRALSVRCKKLGLEVETAENGLQAILKASRNPPRLLILDINMPEADGFRVCEWLLDPQRPPIDVVMLTGRNDSDTLSRCDSFGAFYVPKNQETWDTIKSIMGEVLELDEEVLNAVVPSRAFSASPNKDPLSREKRNKVLIVEDDADLARALERRLKKCGAETLIATNGIEAYRLAAKELPDAIIADYVMPEGGGHYLLWRLKSTESTKHIPIIMITGQRLEPGTEHSLGRETTGRSGAVKMFHKPLDTDALFKELAQHCAIQYEPRA
jgi:CheY-like chemotaxis protein